ncbi:methyltransferase [Candidatus Thiothrix sp. Deng01]|uniref:Methyltransferase n=1 Tax=Candidatus Thiothrix phosphatis TaxID=3112415 RepID=A0ABU6D355_9GAMM|nr:methyltransferase [Candidatus Thiothrix sp. Deng01]MEB4593504.1 methyltransferase [Candidatus Thiothrix sp. Deng01]
MADIPYTDKLREDLRLEAELCGQHFTFLSTWGIFSPREIDEGTALLLKYLKINPADDCFDLGCGYGPIGLAMAKLAPQGQTLMVDKDFMAVEYANRNAALNRLPNARAMLSNGFQHIDRDLRFDVIASNIPAKVGKEMMSILLHDMKQRLKPGGRVYLVTINGLREYMKRNLKEVFGNFDKLKQGAAYTVSYAEKL